MRLRFFCFVILASCGLAIAQTYESTEQLRQARERRTSICKIWSTNDIAAALALNRTENAASKVLLHNVLAANGWNGVTSKYDFDVAGTLATQGGKQMPFTAGIHDSYNRSFVLQTSRGTRGVRMSNGVAEKNLSETKSYAPSWLEGEQFGFLPFLGPLGSAEDQMIAMAGTEATDASHRRLNIFIFQDSPIPGQAKYISKIRVVISTTTTEITEIESCDHVRGLEHPGQTVRRTYGNYVKQSELSYPATITETRDGNLFATISIASLALKSKKTN